MKTSFRYIILSYLVRMKIPCIVIHGGAGTILRSAMTPALEKEYTGALQHALRTGYKVLSDKGSALDAAEAAVICLEDSEYFNAGRGSVFTHDGTHEMDASIMDGLELKAGAVAAVRNIRNPIRLAREVMDHSEHVMLAGNGAEQFARFRNIKFEDDNYFYVQHRYDQLMKIRNEQKVQLDHADKKFGTVGAVALDANGNLAAATSTGGMTNKRYSRIGDTPIIGAGTYANNSTCAVSCTGHGEYFLRAVVAYDISCLIEYKGMSLKEACDFVVYKKLVKTGGEGGLVAIDKSGNIEMPFNSEGMYRGFMNSENLIVKIFRD
jgi:beta-aspartyl-peptidase (threonine type)